MEMKLYSYWRSSCSWRVRLVLALKSIPVELIPIHLVNGGGEQHSEHYLRINALAQVPSLITEEGLSAHSIIGDYELSGRALPSASVATRRPTFARRMSSSNGSHRIWHSALQNLSLLQQIDRWDGDRLLWGKLSKRGSKLLRKSLCKRATVFQSKGIFLVKLHRLLIAAWFHSCIMPDALAVISATSLGAILAEQALLGLPQTASAHPDQQPDAQ